MSRLTGAPGAGERLLADIGAHRRRREATEHLAGWRTLRIDLSGPAEEAAPVVARVVERLLAGRLCRVEVDAGTVVVAVGPPDADELVGAVAAMVEAAGGVPVGRR